MHHDHPSTPPPWPYWQPTPPFNGHTFELAAMLGEIRGESRRHTEIMLGVNDRLIELPERLAQRLAQVLAVGHHPGAAPAVLPPSPSSSSAPTPATSAGALPASPAVSPPPEALSAKGVLAAIGSARDLAMAAIALVALGAALAGKITWSQLLDWMIKLAGIK